MKRLALFDIDGTLISAAGSGARALAAALLEEFALENAMHGISCAGKTDPAIIGEVFEAHLKRPPTGPEYERVVLSYLHHLEAALANADQYRVMPQVRAALAYCRENDITVGLATGNVEDGARLKLAHADLWPEFTFGGFGSDAVCRTDLVAVAIERGCTAANTTFETHNVYVIGDTERDIEAAHGCGVRAVAVATGSRSRETLGRENPYAVVRDLGDLPGVFERAQ